MRPERPRADPTRTPHPTRSRDDRPSHPHRRGPGAAYTLRSDQEDHRRHPPARPGPDRSEERRVGNEGGWRRVRAWEMSKRRTMAGGRSEIKLSMRDKQDVG